jgi:hypothetical protein
LITVFSAFHPTSAALLSHGNTIQDSSRFEIFWQTLGTVSWTSEVELFNLFLLPILVVEDAQMARRAVTAIVAHESFRLYVAAKVSGVAEIQLQEARRNTHTAKHTHIDAFKSLKVLWCR